LPFLHPFTQPFLTLSGWVFGMWRKLFLPLYKIYSLKDEKGLTSIEVSKAEREFVMYKQWKNSNCKIFSSFTSERPSRFGNYVPDYHIPERNEVGWMHGCYWHAHRIQDGCKDRDQKWADQGTTNFVGNSFAMEQYNFKKQQDYLQSVCNINRSNQKVMWTCHWKALKSAPLDDLTTQQKEEALEVRKFMTYYYDNRPTDRLAPRTGYRGGKVESYIFKWRKIDNPKKVLYYYDYNSLYPSVSSHKNNPFPVGKPTIYITKEELEKIQFDKDSCYVIKNEQKIKVKGIAQVKVLAPPLVIPFLQYRVKQINAEKTVSAICRTCAEKSYENVCPHSENERAFCSVWTLDELAYAQTLGYEILQIYEAYIYEEAKPIFSKFLETLAKFKVRKCNKTTI
jgi:G:T-mismatch repair DNA endonuclease (very short patch repair protein)